MTPNRRQNEDDPHTVAAVAGQEHKPLGGTMFDPQPTSPSAPADRWDRALERLAAVTLDALEPRVLWQHDDPAGAFVLLLCRTPDGAIDVELDVQSLDLEGAARLHDALSRLFVAAARRGIAARL